MQMHAVASERHLSSQERVYRYVKDAIIDLRFRPLEKLRAADIAARLDVSRTPVREALSRLEQERLVRREGGWGYSVPPLSFKDAMNVYRVREALEVEAVREATPRVDRHLSLRLEGYLARAQRELKEEQLPAYRQHTRLFYRAIAAAADNDILEHMLALIDDRVRWLGALVADRHFDRPKESLAGNREILAALVAKNEALAERAVRKHVSAARESFLRYVADTPGLFEP